MKLNKFIILVLLQAMISANVFALTLKTSVGTGNWNTAGTWSPSGVPGAGDSAVIANGTTVTLDVNATVGALTIRTGFHFGATASRTITVTTSSGGSGSLDVGGANGILYIGEAAGQIIYVAGNFTCTNGIDWGLEANNPKAVFNGTGSKTLNNNCGQGAFEVNSSTLTLTVTSGPAFIDGNITVTAGTLDMGSMVMDFNSATFGETLSVANGATLKIGGTRGLPTAFPAYSFGATSTVEFYGTAQTISRKIYGNLTLSGSGTKTMPGTSPMTIAGNFTTSGTITATAAQALIVNGNFTIGSGTTFSASSYSDTLRGDFSNSGTFNANTSTFKFMGTNAQSITGVTTFNNLTLNNTKTVNALTLNNAVTVNGALTLTDGHLITTAANVLTLGDAATVTLNGSPQDSSFVKGPMIQTVATASGITKTFPVGQGNIMHRADLIVTQSAATSTQYTGEFFQSSAIALGYTLPGTLTKVSGNNYWTISKGAGAAVTAASVKLYYFATDGVSDAPDLRIAKDNGAGAWIDIGGTGTASPAGTITSTNNFTSFSSFSLANGSGGSNPLPVELLNFDATLKGNFVEITWSTASEINNDYFIVERSRDGLNFEEAAKINVAENSATLLNYKITDEHPFNGESYYRLKQVDINGMFKYSNIRTVTREDHFDNSIFPNPSNDGKTFVSIWGTKAGKVNIVVYDVTGNEEFSKLTVMEQTGMNNFAIDPPHQLVKGVYFVIITTDLNIYKRKLIIN